MVHIFVVTQQFMLHHLDYSGCRSMTLYKQPFNTLRYYEKSQWCLSYQVEMEMEVCNDICHLDARTWSSVIHFKNKQWDSLFAKMHCVRWNWMILWISNWKFHPTSFLLSFHDRLVQPGEFMPDIFLHMVCKLILFQASFVIYHIF